MKKLLLMVLFIFLSTDVATAYNPPKGMADVLRRSMSSSAGQWLARFGHVALYDSSKKQILEVTNGHGVIRYRSTSTMMKNRYKGARYGKANYSQGARALRYGYEQRKYHPEYSISPYYSEGGWGYAWKWSWSKGFYKKWYVKHAKFRCDSFINYCYSKGTGSRLVNPQWKTIPYKIHTALPRRR